MPALELNTEELELLAELLAEARRNLKEEIYKTEGQEFKQLLKEREALLDSLMAKATEAASSRPSS